ncbi:MAG: hypothetical protein AB1627_04615 [Chloroflexota bacterium]
MRELPDPDQVSTRDDFALFVRAMRASLDEALNEPVPARFADDRGGWINWDSRWSFWEAMTGWLEDAGKTDQLSGSPVGQLLIAPVPTSVDQVPYHNPEELRAFLAGVEDWARATTDPSDPSSWALAARAMYAGAIYE